MARQPNGYGMTGDEKARLAVMETKYDHVIEKVDHVIKRQDESNEKFSKAHIDTHERIDTVLNAVNALQASIQNQHSYRKGVIAALTAGAGTVGGLIGSKITLLLSMFAETGK